MALIHTHFFSEALGMCASCDVIIPQNSRSLIGMNTAAGSKVLWLLHGASDDETIWQRRTSIERYASPLGLAVVMPAAHLSSYSNMAHGLNFFSYIADELPEIMHRFFGFSRAREDNFIAGLSMGGGGCLKIGLARPDSYAAIGCLSAGAADITKKPTDERFIRRNRLVYGDRQLENTEEDVRGNAKRLVKSGKPCPRIYHSCGSSDFVLQSAHDTRDFFTSFEGNPFDYKYEEDPGSHTWEYWDEHIQRFFDYIGLKPAGEVRN